MWMLDEMQNFWGTGWVREMSYELGLGFWCLENENGHQNGGGSKITAIPWRNYFHFRWYYSKSIFHVDFESVISFIHRNSLHGRSVHENVGVGEFQVLALSFGVVWVFRFTE